MKVCSIKSYNPNLVSFKNSDKKQEYENPVNRKTERNLAILGSAGTSLLTGAAGFGLATCLTANRKISGLAGAAVAGLTLLLTLPSALYNTKVGSFTRQEQMAVFSRQKAAQKSIYEGINEEVKKEDVPLADKVDLYAKVAMADNGKGVMIKGA